jgi:TonB family protein
MTAFVLASVNSALLLFVAIALLPLLRRRSAALRHLVLAVAFVSAVASPVVGLIAPAWVLPVPLASALPEFVPRLDMVAAPASEPAVAAGGDTAPAERRERSASIEWTRVIAGGWLAGVAISLSVLLCGLLRLAWLRRRATPLTDPAWIEQATTVARAYGIPDPVALLETTHPSLLVTVGLFKPALIVPAAARRWDERRRSVVLAHELAHVLRRDWSVLLVAEVVCAWQWFNPLAWYARARLRQESEQACDDLVLTGGIDGTAYAEQLIAVARDLRMSRQWLPALPMAQPSGFERRITRMLTHPIDRRPATRRAAIIMAIIAVAVTLPLAGLAAQAAISRVAGSVADPQNGLLPGVTLVLTHTTTNVRREIKTDRSGRFEFGSLEPGEYLLQAQLPGFERYESRLTVSGRNLEQDVKLDVGVLQETITVTASPSPATTSAAPPPPDEETFRRLEEARKKLAAQQCTTEPARPASFIGGNIRVPYKLKDVKPIYPETMRASKTTGEVRLNAQIGKDGLVEAITVASATNPAFSEAAIQAVNAWQFSPTLLNCMPTAVRMAVRVNFSAQ